MKNPDSIARLQAVNRVVIKIGSALLVDANGQLRQGVA